MLRAAGEFDSDIPIAATYIRKAASQVETVSDAIRERLLSEKPTGVEKQDDLAV